MSEPIAASGDDLLDRVARALCAFPKTWPCLCVEVHRDNAKAAICEVADAITQRIFVRNDDEDELDPLGITTWLRDSALGKGTPDA